MTKPTLFLAPLLSLSLNVIADHSDSSDVTHAQNCMPRGSLTDYLDVLSGRRKLGFNQ